MRGMKPDWKALFRKAGAAGGRKAARQLGPEGRSARARKAWVTRKARQEQRAKA